MLALGDVEQPVYPRSAVKALQALPLIESGAADRFGLGPEELALACASHSGEPGHVATATRMLALAGLDAGALECGAHWPIHQPSAQALARARRHRGRGPQQLLGQARGLSCVACAIDADPRALYRGRRIRCSALVKATLEDMTGAALSQDVCAIDGCSVPTWAMPLAALARGFARFGTGAGLTPERAKAAARLRAGLRRASLARRRHRPVLHRDHAALRRAGVREDRRGGRLLRGAAGAGPRHCGQMR